MEKSTLYLIPSFLGYHPLEVSHPPAVLERVHKIEHFAVEKIQSAVQFLTKSGHPVPEFKCTFYQLDKRVTAIQLTDITRVLEQGHDVGVLSEAGCPAIADPGADLVWMCHLRGIRVEALVGPSAIIMSMMLAGFNGQNFAFNGYLPINAEQRDEKIRMHQNRSSSEGQSMVYIEVPYRNEELLEALKSGLSSEARLAVAWNILGDDQWVKSEPVMNWSGIKLPEDFNKKPAMFLFLAEPRGSRSHESSPQNKKQRSGNSRTGRNRR